MSSQTPCGQLTRRGRPCRNPARPDSDPPRCARHRARPEAAGAPTQPPLSGLLPVEQERPAGRRTPAVRPPLPGFSPQELAALELDGLAPDLRREVQAVRVVMLRLLGLWNDPTQDIGPEEARRLAALIFTGARTVAHLLSRPAKDADTIDWLAQALDAMGGKHGLAL